MALRNNKTAESGDVVSESQLTGNPKDLVKEGFIELYDDSKAKAKAKADEEAKAKEAFDKAYEEGSLDRDKLDSITMKEIYEYAKKHSLKYDEDAKKTELIDQVLKAEKLEK